MTISLIQKKRGIALKLAGNPPTTEFGPYGRFTATGRDLPGVFHITNSPTTTTVFTSIMMEDNELDRVRPISYHVDPGNGWLVERFGT